MLASEPVNRFMSEAVLTIDVSAPAGEILRLFAGYPVHHLPVVDKTKVVGMLSSADVLKLEFFIPKQAISREAYLDRRVNVTTLMRHPPITIRSDQSVEQAAALMVSHGIHGLPVTDTQENLVGIITTTDIMHAALHLERRGDRSEANPPTDAARVSSADLDRARRLAGSAAGADGEGGEIARAFLHTQSRLKVLEHVLACADRYLRAGQDERLHAGLTKAIELARDVQGEAPALGL